MDIILLETRCQAFVLVAAAKRERCVVMTLLGRHDARCELTPRQFTTTLSGGSIVKIIWSMISSNSYLENLFEGYT